MDFPFDDFFGIDEAPRAVSLAVADKVFRDQICFNDSSALAMLCHRKYWSRLWIIQEIILAAEISIQCGPVSVPWEAFHQAFAERSDETRVKVVDHNLMNTPAFRLFSHRRIKSQREEEGNTIDCAPTLLQVLNQFCGFQCQDIKDKVFGVLSLCRHCCQEAVPADYSLEVTALAAKVLTHDLTCHTQNPKETILVCKVVLSGLELGPLYEKVAAALAQDQNQRNQCVFDDNTLKASKTSLEAVQRVTQQTFKISTKYCGQIVWLSSERSTNKHPLTWTGLVNLILEHELREFGFNIHFFVRGSSALLYFNSDSDHPCNEPTSESCIEGLQLNVTYHPSPLSTRFSIDTKKRRSIFGRLLSPKKEKVISHQPSTLPRTLQTILEQFDAHKPFIPTYAPKSSNEYSERLSKMIEEVWKTKNLAFFVTSTGRFGFATRNVRLSHRVFEVDERGETLAVLSVKGDVCRMTGKGVQVRRGQFAAHREVDVLDDAPRQEVEIQVDMATLFFLGGCF